MPRLGFAKAMFGYFGVRSGKAVADFIKELRSLTVEEKMAFAAMLRHQAGIEIPLAGGGTFVLTTGQESLFEEITKDVVEEAKCLLDQMLKHHAADFTNEEWRRKWAASPIADHEGQLRASLLWVIAHERERLFAELTRRLVSKKGAKKTS